MLVHGDRRGRRLHAHAVGEHRVSAALREIVDADGQVATVGPRELLEARHVVFARTAPVHREDEHSGLLNHYSTSVATRCPPVKLTVTGGLRHHSCGLPDTQALVLCKAIPAQDERLFAFDSPRETHLIDERAGIQSDTRASTPLLFSGAIRGDARGTTVSHCASGGSAGAPESQMAQRYPTSARRFRRLRATVLENTFQVALTVALCREAEPTLLHLVIPAGASVGSKYVSLGTTIVAFKDGDDFDVRLTVNGEGAAKISVMLE